MANRKSMRQLFIQNANYKAYRQGLVWTWPGVTGLETGAVEGGLVD